MGSCPCVFALLTKEKDFCDFLYASLQGQRTAGLVDRVLALHTGSRGFDSLWGHMSEQFFQSNRPGYLLPVSSELENSGIIVRSVIAVSMNVAVASALSNQQKLYMCTHNTTNTTRTDARCRVCAAIVPYS